MEVSIEVCPDPSWFGFEVKRYSGDELLDVQFAHSLAAAREKVPPGLRRVPREAEDPPSFVELWVPHGR